LRFHYAKTTPATAAPAGAAAGAAGTNNNIPDGKYDLCPNCFLQGRLPATHHASDFVKLEEPDYSRIPDKDAAWTNSELLLLLEGLENFDDDWRQIARHVGTRTAEECVMKFLQLEIEDKYLDETPEGGVLKTGGREPVSQLDNPVLSVITYLAQVAEPAVAAAAAGRSVAEVQRILRRQIESVDGQEKEKEKEKEGGKEAQKDGQEKGTAEVKDEDTMELDKEASKTEASTAVSTTTTTTTKPSEEPHTPTPATIALATTAARAAVLASHEEREMTRLVSSAVNTTLQKLELKIAHFNERLTKDEASAKRRKEKQGR
ncbi:hypothetical protein KEM55_008709, partial [Ascosphaera atra]